MGLILPFRASRLAFPGTAPGVNPAHPASQNLLLSAVPAGVTPATAGYVRLSDGLPATASGTTRQGQIYSAMGPTVYQSTQSSDNVYSFSGKLAQAGFTMAVILAVKSAGGVNASCILNDNSASFLNGLNAEAVTNGNFSYVINAAFYDTIPIVFNAPYFFAVSVQSDADNNWVLRRLDTGQVFSGFAFGVNALGTGGSGTFTVANRGSANRPVNGWTGPAMYSQVALSRAQLLRWADDPWSFWYPQRIDLAELLRPPPPAGPTGTLAVTEPTDVAAFAGTVAITGTLATTEAADIAAFVGTGVISGTLATTETTDVAAFAGTAGVNGILATTEATDVAAFTGPGAVSGSLATTEAADAAAFAGNVGSVGVLAATEAADVTAFAGTFTGVVSGTLAAIELTDAAAFAGSAAGLPTGSLAALELPDNVIVLANYRAALQPVSPSPYPSPLDYGWYNSEPDLQISRGRPGGGTQD